MDKKINILINFLVIIIICLGIFSFIKPIRSFDTFKYIRHYQDSTYYSDSINTSTNHSFEMPLFNYGGYRHKTHTPFLGGKILFKIISIFALLIILILLVYFFFF